MESTQSATDAEMDGVESALFGEPQRGMSRSWASGFSLAWLGVWMANLTPTQYLMPEQLAHALANDTWQRSTLDFGIVSGVSAACSVVAYPVVGALSDRTMSRFGRRRPWIALGAGLTAASLILLSTQTTLAGVATCWALATIGLCAVSSALTALIADQVPTRQHGFASSLVAAPQAVGLVLGVLLVADVIPGRVAAYLALSLALVAFVVPFSILLRDPRLPVKFRKPLTPTSFFKGFWISPARFPDFGWTLLSRALANLANALCTSLLLYFLIYGLRRPSAENDLLMLTVIYAFTSVVGSMVCGRISDRIGRRRIFVLVSAALQAAGTLPLALTPNFDVLIVGAIFLGLGFGCFLSVDQALATEVLPDAYSRGKDLGIMNIAAVVPTGLGALLGALVVTVSGNFNSLFAVAVIVGALSAVAVIPIRTVR